MKNDCYFITTPRLYNEHIPNNSILNYLCGEETIMEGLIKYSLLPGYLCLGGKYIETHSQSVL